MEKLNIKLVLLIIFIFILEWVYADPIKKINQDSSVCLEINGKAFIKGKGDTYKVQLVYYNTIIDSVIIKDNGNFKFFLKKDSYYAIRIIKQGYVPQLISICTDLTNVRNKDLFFKFYFETDLISEKESEYLDADALDFPIAIVSFDHRAGWFYYSEEYTSNIKRKIYLCDEEKRTPAKILRIVDLK